jgi:hypothetical protein
MVQKKSVRKSLRKSNKKNKILKKGGDWNGSIFTNSGNSCYVDSLLFPLFYFKMQYPTTLLSTQITNRILEYNNASYKYNNVLKAIQNKWNEFNKPRSILNVCNNVMKEYADIVGGRRTEQRDSLEFFLNTFEFISNSNIFNIITEHKKCYQRIKGSSNKRFLDVEPEERYYDRIKNIDEKFVKIETNNKKYNVLNDLQDYINEYAKETEEFKISDYQFRKKGDTYNLNRHGYPIRDKEPTNNHASNNPDYPYSIIIKDTKTRNFVNTQILIIQLVRESIQGNSIKNKNINIPTTLIIGQYKFILRFATIKKGGTSGGHWMAMINKPDEDGLMFYNDLGPSFSKANEENISLLNTNGFHFFYEKIGGEPNHSINHLSSKVGELHTNVGSSGRHHLTYNVKKYNANPPPPTYNELERIEEQRRIEEQKMIEADIEQRRIEKEKQINKNISNNTEKLIQNVKFNSNEDFIKTTDYIRQIKENPNSLIDDIVIDKKFREILEKIGYIFVTGGKRNNKNKSNRKLKSKTNKSNKKQKNKLKSKSKKSNKK